MEKVRLTQPNRLIEVDPFLPHGEGQPVGFRMGVSPVVDLPGAHPCGLRNVESSELESRVVRGPVPFHVKQAAPLSLRVRERSDPGDQFSFHLDVLDDSHDVVVNVRRPQYRHAGMIE
jgi:hypothetical protein